MSRLPSSALQTPEATIRQKQPSSVPLRIFAACLTSATVAVNYTNYSPLIAVLRAALHTGSDKIGLFSTLLFLGLAIAYIPAGMLADRFGARLVIIYSSALLFVSAIVLPLFPNLLWLLFWRFLVGLGSGGAFIAGAGIAAGVGKHASLGQGFYGGATQIGSGMGLLLTPFLYPHIGWRGCFLLWGLLSSLSLVVWLFVNDGQEPRRTSNINLGAATHSPAVWSLGLSHLGTFGLGNAIAAWITVYLVLQYQLPLTLAATFGAVALLTGMFFRPIGGLLIARHIIGAIPLLRMGTIMGFLGVALLAIPLRFPPFAIIGISLIAIGSTMPYTSAFNSAANLRTVGKGVAQGFMSVLSSPALIIGPPLIGFLLDRTGNFTFAFGSILLFGAVAITASFLAGPMVARETIP